MSNIEAVSQTQNITVDSASMVAEVVSVDQAINLSSNPSAIKLDTPVEQNITINAATSTILLTSNTQSIVVNSFASTASIINAGPIGPTGATGPSDTATKLTTDGQLLTRAVGQLVGITRADLAADSAFTSAITTGSTTVSNAAIAAHVALSDPHPIYLTAAEGDAAYLKLSGGTLTGPLLHTAGTVAAPGLSFSGDTNTGLYSSAADTIALVTNGTERLTISPTGVVTVPTSLVLSVATGTAPLTVTSTTVVTNFNADLLDGKQGSAFLYSNHNANIMQRGSATVTFTAAQTSDTATVTFPTAFGGTPTVVAIPSAITGNTPVTVSMTGISSTQFTLLARMTNGTYTGNINLYWIAIGAS